MPFPTVVRPGMALTANRLNAAFAGGRTVFVAYRDTGQTISSSSTGQAANALIWDDVEVDSLGGWDAGQPTRYTPTEPGRYWVAGSVGFNANGDTAVRGCSWRLDGGLVKAATSRVGNTPGDIPSINATPLAIVFNGSGNYIELCPFQDSGSGLDTASGSNRPSITIVYTGPD